MFRWIARSTLLLIFGAAALGQPVVNAIENNYSYVPPGLPGYGIAQGSIFVIFGSNLAPDSSGLLSAPLKTSVHGVSVQFAVQGATSQALIYYVTPTQIAGILPSATPLGAGTVTVTSGGKSSDPAPLTVVQSAIGLLTLFGSGSGPAIAFDSNWGQLFPFNAAHPGDVIVLYGSGAGPVSGDESVQQIPQNLSDIPLEVDIGGVPAAVTYHGRSLYPGLDQINVIVPQGPVGCNVPIVARSGNYASNFPVIPVAVGSRTCSDDVPGVTVVTLEVTAAKNTVNLGVVTLIGTENVENSGSASLFESLVLASDSAAAGFDRGPSQPGSIGHLGNSPYPSFGNCVVDYFGSSGQLAPVFVSASPPEMVGTGTVSSGSSIMVLNAGPRFTFTGPNGTDSFPFQPAPLGGYAGTLAASTGMGFFPRNGGLFTISNGSGGPDLGGFSVSVNVPPPLVWSNVSTMPFIDRTKPLTLAWSGGNPSGYVTISGGASVPYGSGSVGASFHCSAPVSARQFTIPASVLAALPAESAGTASVRGPDVSIEDEADFVFVVPGLDGGYLRFVSVTNLDVAIQ